MSNDHKVQIGIFRIENSIYLTDLDASLLQDGYKQQSLSATNTEELQLKLYYTIAPVSPKWKSFLEPIADKDAPVCKLWQSNAEGFVLLIKWQSDSSIYAAVGGSGYFAIHDSIDDNFGMDIVSRLINKEDRVLRAAKEKNFVGGISGAAKYFRKNFNLFENDGFGKIYHELSAVLNPKLLKEKIGIELGDLKKGSLCIAKSSFKINKDISIQQLLEMTQKCGVLLGEEGIAINNVERICKRKNSQLIASLEKELMIQLWKLYTEEEKAVSFDLCHRDFEEYLTASKYIVKNRLSKKNYFGEEVYDELTDVCDIFAKIRKKEGEDFKFERFVELLGGLKIYSYNADDTDLTKGTLISHLFGDVTFNEEKFFLIENTWYKIEQSFIKELDASCAHFVSTGYVDDLLREWETGKSEGEYNRSYIGETNTIVLDRVTPHNIELCDILKWDEKTLYLCHVKSGFGNTVRDLAAQIRIAASKLSHDMATTKSYIGEVYDSLKDKIGDDKLLDKTGRQSEKHSRADFIKLFDKKIVFVFAVMDSGENERSIKDISKFNSNIAKFSLSELSRDMRGLGLDFGITQILRGTK